MKDALQSRKKMSKRILVSSVGFQLNGIITCMVLVFSRCIKSDHMQLEC